MDRHRVQGHLSHSEKALRTRTLPQVIFPGQEAGNIIPESVAAPSTHHEARFHIDMVTVPVKLEASKTPPDIQPMGMSRQQGHDGVFVQRKMTVGDAGDKNEQEADRVAKTVVEQINRLENTQTFNQQQELSSGSGVGSRKPQLQQRLSKPGVGSVEVGAEKESAINRERGYGRALDKEMQAAMGEAMGADFSQVRVHTGTGADALNKSFNARAFTTGADIFFRQGAYNPKSREGKALIAHELTHVVQQGYGIAGDSKSLGSDRARTVHRKVWIQHAGVPKAEVTEEWLDEREITLTKYKLRTPAGRRLLEVLNKIADEEHHWTYGAGGEDELKQWIEAGALKENKWKKLIGEEESRDTHKSRVLKEKTKDSQPRRRKKGKTSSLAADSSNALRQAPRELLLENKASTDTVLDMGGVLSGQPKATQSDIGKLIKAGKETTEKLKEAQKNLILLAKDKVSRDREVRRALIWGELLGATGVVPAMAAVFGDATTYLDFGLGAGSVGVFLSLLPKLDVLIDAIWRGKQVGDALWLLVSTFSRSIALWLLWLAGTGATLSGYPLTVFLLVFGGLLYAFSVLINGVMEYLSRLEDKEHRVAVETWENAKRAQNNWFVM